MLTSARVSVGAFQKASIRLQLRTWWAIVSVGVVLSACGNDEIPRSEVPQAEYVVQAASTVCAVLSRCCRESGFPIDEATCEASAGDRFGADYARYDFSAVRYDGAAAADCLRDFTEAFGDCSVAEGAANIPACAAVFVGLRRPGEPCSSDDQCARENGKRADCKQVTDPATGAVTGACEVVTPVVHGKSGEACRATCYDRDPDGSGILICGNPIGEPGNVAPTTDCYVSDGLRCAYGAESAGTCQPLSPMGATCQLNDCRAGLFCDIVSGTCRPQDASADCSMNVDACDSASFCSESGVCEPKRSPGASCARDFECLGGNCNDRGVCGLDVLGSARTCMPPF